MLDFSAFSKMNVSILLLAISKWLKLQEPDCIHSEDNLTKFNFFFFLSLQLFQKRRYFMLKVSVHLFPRWYYCLSLINGSTYTPTVRTTLEISIPTPLTKDISASRTARNFVQKKRNCFHQIIFKMKVIWFLQLQPFRNGKQKNENIQFHKC